MMGVKCVELVPYGSNRPQNVGFFKHERRVKMLHIVTSGEPGKTNRVPHKTRILATNSQKSNKINVGQNMCINMDLSENTVPRKPLVCHHVPF
jgi:hypothetical protein